MSTIQQLLPAFNDAGGGGGGVVVFESATASQSVTDVNSHPVDMPATVNAGDLLIILITYRAAASRTFDTPAGGWATLGTISGLTGQSLQGMGGFYKVADGTEGGTTVNVVMASSGTGNTASLAIRISGQAAVSGAGVAGGASGSPNPPSHASGYSGNILWIAGFGAQGASTPSAYPAGFTDNHINSLSTGTRSCETCIATKFDTASTVDPGNFSVSSTYWRAFTIAVSP